MEFDMTSTLYGEVDEGEKCQTLESRANNRKEFLRPLLSGRQTVIESNVMQSYFNLIFYQPRQRLSVSLISIGLSPCNGAVEICLLNSFIDSVPYIMLLGHFNQTRSTSI